MVGACASAQPSPVCPRVDAQLNLDRYGLSCIVINVYSTQSDSDIWFMSIINTRRNLGVTYFARSLYLEEHGKNAAPITASWFDPNNAQYLVYWYGAIVSMLMMTRMFNFHIASPETTVIQINSKYD